MLCRLIIDIESIKVSPPEMYDHDSALIFVRYKFWKIFSCMYDSLFSWLALSHFISANNKTKPLQLHHQFIKPYNLISFHCKFVIKEEALVAYFFLFLFQNQRNKISYLNYIASLSSKIYLFILNITTTLTWLCCSITKSVIKYFFSTE